MNAGVYPTPERQHERPGQARPREWPPSLAARVRAGEEEQSVLLSQTSQSSTQSDPARDNTQQ